ncbi:MAG: phosphohistidine-like domain-containing protein [bacterium]
MIEEIKAKNGLKLLVEKRRINDLTEISLRMENKTDCLLHWGLSRHVQSTWETPPKSLWPEGTKMFGRSALQTPFLKQNGENRILIRLDRSVDHPILDFVLFFPEDGRWDNNQGRNYRIKLPKPAGLPPSDPRIHPGSFEYSEIAEEIIQAETGRDSWTLMHRFNLCYHLLDKVDKHPEGLATLFVWLRFSAIRQLTWQRNFNTQPRELSYAMDRLTQRLSEIYIRSEPESREFIRLIFTTMGRGGEGQLIRDEFLNIMHKHKIKEIAGSFMEEWHQKIHNNATPDDIIICDAYLAFLRSDGNLNLFYKTVADGGVPRKRLGSFERPILADPEFYPDIKEALILDLENYLKILKSVHSGTDLETAIDSARDHLDKKTFGLLNFIWLHRNARPEKLENLMAKIAQVRSHLNQLLPQDRDSERIRDLILLDLALDAFLRSLIERHIHTRLSGDQLVDMIAVVVQNLIISHNGHEFQACFHHWMRLKEMPNFGKDWSLHAKSVVDRLLRTIGNFNDRYYRIIQPKAEHLGNAFQADEWSITLFAEEVVRGRAVFILSMLLRHIEPKLRKAANLGQWQVISPGQGTGRVKMVDQLRYIQGKTFLTPTVIIADKITGDEEIPEGVTALITPDVTDIVSHISVRARNKGILFATCYDTGILEQLRSSKGRFIHLRSAPSGEVVVMEVQENQEIMQASGSKAESANPIRPDFTLNPIPSKDFNDRRVGGKSLNLKNLEGKMPEWIHMPASVGVPFGILERLLEEPENQAASKRNQSLIPRIHENPGEILDEIRRNLLGLNPQQGFISSLRHVMEDKGMKWPEEWQNAWMCIKRVWASKWNERAYLSRKAWGIPDKDIFLAVLIQEVIEAEYAFVIHTVNPFTKDRNEIYAEVVLGLGETLVGNYPGRALAFSCNKEKPGPRILAYPSKSTALYGGGLIFRSDSNGEDLSGYAGAGLYDSVMLPPPRKVPLDYTKDPLLWDENFRTDLLMHICEIGLAVERAFGNTPQDIEGACAKGEYYVVQSRPQVGLKGAGFGNESE